MTFRAKMPAILMTAAVWGVAPRLAAADQSDTLPQKRLGDLRPGTQVRLTTTQSILYGRFRGVTADQISLDPIARRFSFDSAGPIQLRRQDVTSAEYLVGEHRLRGALVGGTIGALTGILIGATVGGGLGDVSSTAVGLSLGGLLSPIGALFGWELLSGTAGWHRVRMP